MLFILKLYHTIFKINFLSWFIKLSHLLSFLCLFLIDIYFLFNIFLLFLSLFLFILFVEFIILSNIFLFCFIIWLCVWFLEASIMIFLLFECISSLIQDFLHCQCSLREISSISSYFIYTPIMNILNYLLSWWEVFYIIIFIYPYRIKVMCKLNDNSK